MKNILFVCCKINLKSRSFCFGDYDFSDSNYYQSGNSEMKVTEAHFLTPFGYLSANSQEEFDRLWRKFFLFLEILIFL